jgi:hypothetical protein
MRAVVLRQLHYGTMIEAGTVVSTTGATEIIADTAMGITATIGTNGRVAQCRGEPGDNTNCRLARPKATKVASDFWN